MAGAEIRANFEQHLAPDVVRRSPATGGPASRRARDITALFTDIEGFTNMTERVDPGDLVALLDTYFDVTARIATDHGGMIDKIVGDAVHVIFDALTRWTTTRARRVLRAGVLEASEEVRRSPMGRRLRLGADAYRHRDRAGNRWRYRRQPGSSTTPPMATQ